MLSDLGDSHRKLVTTVSVKSAGRFQPRNIWIGVVFFFLSMAPGMWMPALPNILEAHGVLWVIGYGAAIGPAVAILSSLAFAALADNRVEAQKLLGYLSLSGAIFLWLSFSCLEWGWSAWWYVVFQGLNALLGGPMWALLTKVALVHARNAERDFPLFRVWGSVGWIVAGVIVSYFMLDSSVKAGQWAAYIRVMVGFLAFMLPRTFPEQQQSSMGWRERLGLPAFSLFKDRALRVYLVATLLLTIPLCAFYMYAPLLLNQLGDKDHSGFANAVQWLLPGATAQMTIGQVVEIGAMLFLSYYGARARVKWLMVLAMVCCLIRYTLFALAGEFSLMSLMIIGVAIHGICYTFFSITGQVFIDRRVPKNMRAQAQALISQLTHVGGMAGPLMIGWLYARTVDTGGWSRWPLFWWILTGAVAVSVIYFVLGFSSKRENE